MNNVWHFVKEQSELVSRLFKHKVCHVVETRTPQVVSWKGELDNEDFFFILVMDGVLSASYEEHEMMLPYDIHTVAYITEVEDNINTKDPVERFINMIKLQKDILPKVMNNLDFKEIMEIFMWEYVSPAVEIYETISL